MAIDLKSMNRAQLQDLIKRAEQRMLEVEKERLSKVREKIQALLKTEGFTLDEVSGGSRKVRRPVAAKYQNPSDRSQTWSGRGKRPRWFNAALKAGKKEQDLLIK